MSGSHDSAKARAASLAPVETSEPGFRPLSQKFDGQLRFDFDSPGRTLPARQETSVPEQSSSATAITRDGQPPALDSQPLPLSLRPSPCLGAALKVPTLPRTLSSTSTWPGSHPAMAGTCSSRRVVHATNVLCASAASPLTSSPAAPMAVISLQLGPLSSSSLPTCSRSPPLRFLRLRRPPLLGLAPLPSAVSSLRPHLHLRLQPPGPTPSPPAVFLSTAPPIPSSSTDA